MALNMADIFEHAADAFPDRIALICGDLQVTYSELEDEANRLAHHLAAQGVGPGGHVGLYAHNSVETVATLLAAVKLRAVAVNINFRYLEGELAYHLRDSDLCALVHDQELAPIVDAVVSAGLPRVSIGGSYGEAVLACSAARDFGPRSPDDIYIIYTGGTTGHPKGVMWRHEDIWQTLGGGIDFVTGETLDDEVVSQSPHRGRGRRHVVACAAPPPHPRRRHGGHPCLPVHRGHGRDPAEVRPARGLGGGPAAPGQRAVDHRRRDGAAADGGPRGRRLRHLLADLAQLHRRAVLARGQGRVRQGAAQMDAYISEAIGSTETGFHAASRSSTSMTSTGATPPSAPGRTITASPSIDER